MTAGSRRAGGVSYGVVMDYVPDAVEALVAQARRALAERAKIPPGERFDQLVKLGLIDEQGRLRTDNVQEVPISKLFEGRNGDGRSG